MLVVYKNEYVGKSHDGRITNSSQEVFAVDKKLTIFNCEHM